MRYLPWGAHTLPPLPYAYNALEPFISARNLRIHHDVLHLGYVEGLNRIESELVRARERNDYSLIKHWERELAFYGSGHILHCIYWTNLSPRGGVPQEHTQRLISRDFGSLNASKPSSLKLRKKWKRQAGAFWSGSLLLSAYKSSLQKNTRI